MTPQWAETTQFWPARLAMQATSSASNFLGSCRMAPAARPRDKVRREWVWGDIVNAMLFGRARGVRSRQGKGVNHEKSIHGNVSTAIAQGVYPHRRRRSAGRRGP